MGILSSYSYVLSPILGSDFLSLIFVLFFSLKKENKKAVLLIPFSLQRRSTTNSIWVYLSSMKPKLALTPSRFS